MLEIKLQPLETDPPPFFSFFFLNKYHFCFAGYVNMFRHYKTYRQL